MKILHILYDEVNNPWFGGGAALRNQEIYKRLSRKHDVTFICGTYPGSKKYEIKNGIRYIRLGKGNNVWKSLISFCLNVFFFKKFHCYNLIVKDLLAICPVYTPFLPKNIPVVASIQNMDYQFYRSYKLLGVLPWINHEMSIRNYRKYLLTANSMLGHLKKKATKNSSIKVVPYGIEDNLFNAMASEENYILYLGRYDIYQKGLDILLESYKIVAKTFPDIKLILAGGGRDDHKLEKLVDNLALTKQVIFKGRVYGEQKRRLIADCLFACRPSRFESFGLGALEASACGKAVIVSSVAGNLETVKPNETGVIVEPENIEQLADEMLELIRNPQKRRSLALAGKEWAKNFKWDNLAKEQEQYYIQVVNEWEI